MTEKSTTIKASCRKCKGKTKHVVLCEETSTIDDDRAGYWQSDQYQIIQCAGCELVSFRHASRSSDDVDEENDPIPFVKLYPSPDAREPIRITFYLPHKVGHVYRESLNAMNHQAPLLAAIGLRAVVEGICDDKKCKGRDLALKINDLSTKGFLSHKQADFLHLQRFMGNTAAHEIQAPEKAELEAALSIVETLLTTLYDLPRIAANMQKSQKHLAKMKATTRKSKVVAIP